MSASLCSVEIYFTVFVPFCTWLRMKWRRTSICFARADEGYPAVMWSIADWWSLHNGVPYAASYQASCITRRIHSFSLTTSVIAKSLASNVESATDDYFFNVHKHCADPSLTKNLVVDISSCTSPAWSESTNASSCRLTWLNTMHNTDLPRRNQRTCLAAW